MLDYHIHVAAHGEYKYTDDWLNLYLAAARKRGINDLGLLEHDEFLSEVDVNLLRCLTAQHPDMLIRRGLEVDYIPGREKDIKQIMTGLKLDYVIGSIHFIDGWGFDHPDYRNRFDHQDIDEVYANYYNLVGQAAHSGLFDIIGHIDLVKIWGHRPVKTDVISCLEPVLKDIKRGGLVVEINSAGLRKPVGEIYPQQEIIEALFTANIPITLGSDAHHPDQVGEGLDQARMAAARAGYRYVTGFDRRQRYYVDL